MTLVGVHLADVHRAARGLDRVPGDEPGLSPPFVEGDRLVPAAFPVGEGPEIVEHDRLAAEIADLLVDLERAVGVGCEIGAAPFDLDPVEHEAGPSLGRECAGSDRVVDGLDAQRGSASSGRPSAARTIAYHGLELRASFTRFEPCGFEQAESRAARS